MWEKMIKSYWKSPLIDTAILCQRRKGGFSSGVNETGTAHNVLLQTLVTLGAVGS